jgi:hypothetical protein
MSTFVLIAVYILNRGDFGMRALLNEQETSFLVCLAQVTTLVDWRVEVLGKEVWLVR